LEELGIHRKIVREWILGTQGGKVWIATSDRVS
jgi:hypothetical protein